MKEKYLILVGLLFLALGYFWGYKTTTPERVEIVQQDTITIVKIDTIPFPQPIPYKVEIVRNDTIYINDTIYVALPIEIKEYQAEEYYAKISGYKPNLDYIEVFQKETIKYINTTEKVYSKPKKWGVGVQLGAGIVIGDKVQLKPYLGLGLSYNFITF